MINKQEQAASKASIFAAIRQATPTASAQTDIAAIQQEAQALLAESKYARPPLLSDNATEAFIKRINKELVIGTTCETISTLAELPQKVEQFLAQYDLPKAVKVQEIQALQSIDWKDITIDVDIQNDNTVGICWAEYGVAETGSFVVHSSPDMPILLNFLPLYLIPIIPKSKILHFIDDYALIANDIAKQGTTPRNMCLISGASGTTDIEGVLVQGAHGPEFLHIIIVEDL